MWNIFENFVKCAIVLLHPTKFFTGHPEINEILTAISYFRILYIYSYLVKITKYYGTRPNRVLSLYGHRIKSISIRFAIKCLFKEQGLLTNIFLLFFATVVLGLVGITFTKGVPLLTEIYLYLITITKVGYGELSTDGSTSKIILIVVIILGSFASSASTIYFLRFL